MNDKRPAEIKVFISNRDARCDDCGNDLGRRAWITLAGERGALCLACADLDHLAFLPSGDAALTRRTRKYSALSAVVLKWSSARKRYERQGLLVEEDALDRAQVECLSDAEPHAGSGPRCGARSLMLPTLPASPRRFVSATLDVLKGREQVIAEHACLKYSGRVGRTAAAKDLQPEPLDLAIAAHVRHQETKYDRLLAQGILRDAARAQVRPDVDRILARWRGDYPYLVA